MFCCILRVLYKILNWRWYVGRMTSVKHTRPSCFFFSIGFVFKYIFFSWYFWHQAFLHLYFVIPPQGCAGEVSCPGLFPASRDQPLCNRSYLKHVECQRRACTYRAWYRSVINMNGIFFVPIIVIAKYFYKYDSLIRLSMIWLTNFQSICNI